MDRVECAPSRVRKLGEPGASVTGSESSAAIRPGPWKLDARDALAIGILTVAVLIAFSDVAGSARGLYFRDHTTVFKPGWQAAVEAVREGRYPVLTMAQSEGIPFERTLAFTQVPAWIVLLLGSFDVAYDYFVILQFVFLGIGVYLLARALGARAVEASLVSVFFTICGPVLSFENLLANLWATATAPWMYLAAVRFLRRVDLASTAWLALTFGLHAQGVIPIVALVDLGMGVSLLLVIRPRLNGRLAIGLRAGIAVGLCIASAVLAPALEMLGHGSRGAGFSYERATHWSFHPLQSLELLAPSLWSPPDAPFINAVKVTGGRALSYMTSLYLGTGLSLVVVGLLGSGARRFRVAVAAALGLCILLALGGATPVHRLFWSLPLAASTRNPVKFIFVAMVVVAPLLVLAVRNIERSARLLVAVAAGQLVLLGLMFWWVTPQSLGQWFSTPPVTALPEGVVPADFPEIAVSSMRPRIVHGAIFAFLLLVSSSVAIWHRGFRTSLGWFAVLLLAADLGLAGRWTVVGASVDHGLPEHVAEILRSPTHRVYTATPRGLTARPFKRQGDPSYYEAYSRSARARGRIGTSGIRFFDDQDRDGLSHGHPKIAFDLLQRLPWSKAERLLARMGVAWISTTYPETGPETTVLEIEGERPHYFSPIPSPRPYVTAYARAVALPRGTTPRAKLEELLTAPQHWDQAVFLQRDRQPLVATSSTAARACIGSSSTELEPVSRHGHLIIKHHALCDTVVVALETKMLGWEARVDGKPAELLDSEMGHLTVFVPAGAREVEFEYISSTGRWAPVSFGGLALVVLGLGLGWVRRREPR